jgi:hypothetical protein
VLISIVLFVVGGIWFTVGGVRLLGAASDMDELRADGRPVVLAAPAEDDRMLWIAAGVTPPDCSVVDVRSGLELASEEVDRYHTTGPGGGELDSFLRFRSTEGDVEVTCTSSSPSTVYASEAFDFPWMMRLLAGWLAPAAALMVLAVGLVGLEWRRRNRTRRSGDDSAA